MPTDICPLTGERRRPLPTHEGREYYPCDQPKPDTPALARAPRLIMYRHLDRVEIRWVPAGDMVAGLVIGLGDETPTVHPGWSCSICGLPCEREGHVCPD